MERQLAWNPFSPELWQAPHISNRVLRHDPCLGSRQSTAYAVEIMTAAYQNRIELLQGTLDLLIVQTLQWGPQHGYGIVQCIRTGSSDTSAN